MRKLKEIGTGGFRPGFDGYNLGRHRVNTPGPSSGADSSFSRLSQYQARDVTEDEEEEELDDILENRVYRKGKYQLMETLENIKDEESDDPLDEFSGAAATGGGPAVPLGYTAKGKPETPSQRRKRQQFNITKSYPYTKLANPPRSSKKRRKRKK
tara:strand:+ start:34 stop:498 length:465 start_codon:yes stop_codon:yes gene_type:complete